MGTIASDAIDSDPFKAHLGPTRVAVLTGAAAKIVVIHDALTDPGLVHALTDIGHHTTGLMSADDDTPVAKTKRGGAVLSPVKFKITAAHSRGLDFQYHLVRSRHRIRKGLHLQLAATKKNDSLHRLSSCFDSN